jgi:hypothetical protein
MSRVRQSTQIRKARLAKRETALDLARHFGHGTEMPDGDEPRDEDSPGDITEAEKKESVQVTLPNA